MKIIDLFSGVGGLSLGFEWAGFETIVSLDIWKDAINTYNHNRKNKCGIVKDIHEFNEVDVHEIIEKHKITGVIGGPPCQGFSTVGTRDINDERNHLYLEFYKTVKTVMPEFFVIENVRGMLTLNNGLFVKDVLERFGNLGYKIEYKLVNASDYGVPQNRHRVFFVGFKNSKFEFPKIKDYKVSTSDALSDLPIKLPTANLEYITKPKNDFQKMMRKDAKSIKNHEHTEHSEQTINVISKVPDGGNIKSLPEEYWQIRKYNKAFQRMNSNLPSNTIDTGHRNYFHYSENRIPTARESARLQSFPDDFEFIGTKGSQYKQIGNAVPPILAKAIAVSVKNQINLK